MPSKGQLQRGQGRGVRKVGTSVLTQELTGKWACLYVFYWDFKIRYFYIYLWWTIVILMNFMGILVEGLKIFAEIIHVHHEHEDGHEDCERA